MYPKNVNSVCFYINEVVNLKTQLFCGSIFNGLTLSMGVSLRLISVCPLPVILFSIYKPFFEFSFTTMTITFRVTRVATNKINGN